MKAFVVSARKYRPVKFDDVVGQNHITTTLKNALRSNQLAHAFLFCGPRGVGKTTNARILAKVVNCLNLTADSEPCNECSSCVSFNSNSSFNIFELDAASNNGVDDIRKLVEQVRIPPQGVKYKVYIIDEVHMLTAQAFNAFLKTLEEPPHYAIFILATTEKQKIIPTILSRCQVFDFKRIRLEDMVAYLRKIATDRNVQVNDEALHLIAQKADGGMRDALSLFDKMASFCNGNINTNEVLDQLNILDYEFNFKMTEAMLVEDRATVLQSFQEILMKGFEGDNVINAMAEHFRNLLMCKDAATVQLLEATDALKLRYANQAKSTPLAFLLSALNIINDSDLHYRNAKNRRLHVEMCLIKLCYLNRVLQQPQAFAVPNNISIDEKKKTDEVIAPQKIVAQIENKVAEIASKPLSTAGSKPTGSSAENSSSLNMKGNFLENLKNKITPKSIASTPVVEEKPTEYVAEKIAEEKKVEQKTESISSSKKQIYTPMEKFNAMVEAHPELKNLANELNLEVDF